MRPFPPFDDTRRNERSSSWPPSAGPGPQSVHTNDKLERHDVCSVLFRFGFGVFSTNPQFVVLCARHNQITLCASGPSLMKHRPLERRSPASQLARPARELTNCPTKTNRNDGWLKGTTQNGQPDLLPCWIMSPTRDSRLMDG